MEVVEHVLLVLAHARAMPVLAFLGTAAQVGDRVDTAGFHPREGGGGVRRRHRGTETAVSVKNCRPRLDRIAVPGQHGEAHRRVVGTAVDDLTCVYCRHVDRSGRMRPHVERTRAGVVVVRRRRRQKIRVREPRLAAAFGSLTEAAHGPESRQLDEATTPTLSEVVHGDLGDRVPGPAGQQCRRVHIGTVEDREVFEDGFSVLGHEVAPVVVTGVLR